MTPPDTLVPFLTAKGSLTALLEQKAGQPLRVQIIYEGHQPIDFYHKKLLNLPLHRPALAWVREVLLFGNETKAWVRAKSIFPIDSLSGNAKRLRHLKNTPIGYVMFKKNRQLPHKRTIFFDEYWGRNTVYDWHRRQILVQEIFLAM
ncbi:chorismate lyase [Moraxella sp. VT-16-12]|uniref:chorismate--pyruvate lyase family protein n=1 Tax=Moraxella sp. VT-16-12 TaxID=2014877 RepID=UPI000B7EBDCC|nr:chorismate lyase [Moraxella sp. VT-16-12]TWV84670.1 chorismate lyase [Moraxella sp. VT-16-12]